MEDMKKFVAYARKLLRVINKIEKALNDNDFETAKTLVAELKEDTQKDIEAYETAGAIRLLPFNQIADSSVYILDHLQIPNDY